MREKVIDSARRIGLDVGPRRLPCSIATAADAAVAVGCGERRIASAAVFIADGDPVVCVTCGADSVDLDRLADALDVAEIRPATRDEVRAATGYSADGVPPFGHEL